MKRFVCVFFVMLLLTGKGVPSLAASVVNENEPLSTLSPIEAPHSALPTYPPRDEQDVLFAEELLSRDGEPIAALVRSLLSETDLSKEAFSTRFELIVQRAGALEECLLALSNRQRTLTAERRDQTVSSLLTLMDDETLNALQVAYAACEGEGDALPLDAYSASVNALCETVQGMEARNLPFFDLDAAGAKDYLMVLSRYMGETLLPQDAFAALEVLVQTEAYAIAAALQADPEAERKRVPISLGGFTSNLSFLRRVTEELCPLPDGSRLSIPFGCEGEEDMELPELAFYHYPGMAFLKAYAERSSEAQQARWANAPDGYLAGLAIHGSYVVLLYLAEDFGIEYLQYRWYTDMLDVTLTGLTALLIHYYGYSLDGLRTYLQDTWGAGDFADYLYEQAMEDPFDSLTAAYGYWLYLDICQAALDAGCETESQFLRDYLAAGPAPSADLKEYMVKLYQNQG